MLALGDATDWPRSFPDWPHLNLFTQLTKRFAELTKRIWRQRGRVCDCIWILSSLNLLLY